MSQLSQCGSSGGKLAIVSIDLTGYTRLMEVDEQGTHRALMACRRDILEPIVAQHDGHIIKSTGDGALITFPAAENALNGMIAFQERIADREISFPKSRRLVFRVGIHLAEAIYDEGDLYGHGVNLAVRLQEAAEPGSIYLSGETVEELSDTTLLALAQLGSRTFKNLSKPIVLYRWQSAANRCRKRSSRKAALLAATIFFLVSSTTEQGKVQVGNDIDGRLGDEFGKTLHQHPDFADRSNDGLRAKRYNPGLVEEAKDDFASTWAKDKGLYGHVPERRVTEAEIVERIAPNEFEDMRLKQRAIKIRNGLARDTYIQAWTHYAENSPKGLRWAVNDLNKAIELDPSYSRAHALLAACYWTIWQNQWQKDLRLTASEVLRLAKQHLNAVNEPIAMAHAVTSEMLTASGRYLDALAEAELAISADQTAASGYYAKGLALTFNGQPTDGEELILIAIEKNVYLSRFLFGLALSQFNADRFDDALSTLSYATQQNSESDWSHFLLAATLGQLGREHEAQTALEHFKNLGSQRRGWVENYLPYTRNWPFRKEQDRLRLREGLLNADANASFRLAIR